MKKLVLFGMVVSALIFSTSCKKLSLEIQRLQGERDSLAIINERNAVEMEEILSILNEVEDNFRNIKAAENYLSVQSSKPGELNPTTKVRIRSDMQLITETLEKNREKISELESKLNASSLQSQQLQQIVSKLRQELGQKTMALVTLNEELERKNTQISELSTNVNKLSNEVQELRTRSNAQQQTIVKQEKKQKEMATVYYCFGTSNELKKQKILVNDQLGSNFNRDYFITVRDVNSLRVIPLQAKKGKLVSKHPDGSYEFVKDSNNQVELHILDPVNFWSLTRYLAILVNV